MADPKKKKPSGGKNVTPRKPVQFPVAWLEVARERARQNKRPTLWHLIELLKADAEQAGMKNLPPAPWEEEGKSSK
jgi:hypothetical protein